MDISGFPVSQTAQAADRLTMTLVPDSQSCPSGSMPGFTVHIKNTSSQPVTLCTYMLEYRLKASLTATNSGEGSDYEIHPFHTQKWAPLTGNDFKTLNAGEEIKIHLALSKDTLFGFIARHSQPPVVPSSHKIKGFPAGSYEFSVVLSEQMALYIGEDGVYDYKQETRVLNQIPICKEKKAFFAFLRATAHVTFK